MTRAVILALCMLMGVVATDVLRAQQTASTNERALGARLIKEMNTGLVCDAALLMAQEEITRLQAKVKELETPK